MTNCKNCEKPMSVWKPEQHRHNDSAECYPLTGDEKWPYTCRTTNLCPTCGSRVCVCVGDGPIRYVCCNQIKDREHYSTCIYNYQKKNATAIKLLAAYEIVTEDGLGLHPKFCEYTHEQSKTESFTEETPQEQIENTLLKLKCLGD